MTIILENKHIVGHVGRFMSQKNHTFLLDVFAEVSKRDSLAHLVLLGDGELMDAMKEKASNLGIKDRVTFVGNVGNANEWYQAFDCFVLPSVWEGLPVVGVEAQAADLPCIFFFRCNTRDWFVRSCKIHPAYRRNLDLGN